MNFSVITITLLMLSAAVITITLLMLSAAVDCLPVKDKDGRDVMTGEEYYIQPVKTKENNGGGIAPAPPQLLPSFCPLGVVQSLLPTEPGLPVSFKVIGVSSKTAFQLSSAVNIKFESQVWVCNPLTKFWEVDPAAKLPFVLNGDKPGEKISQFKIETTVANTKTYRFTTSVGSVPIGTIPG